MRKQFPERVFQTTDLLPQRKDWNTFREGYVKRYQVAEAIDDKTRQLSQQLLAARRGDAPYPDLGGLQPLQRGAVPLPDCLDVTPWRNDILTQDTPDPVTDPSKCCCYACHSSLSSHATHAVQPKESNPGKRAGASFRLFNYFYVTWRPAGRWTDTRDRYDFRWNPRHTSSKGKERQQHLGRPLFIVRPTATMAYPVDQAIQAPAGPQLGGGESRPPFGLANPFKITWPLLRPEDSPSASIAWSDLLGAYGMTATAEAELQRSRQEGTQPTGSVTNRGGTQARRRQRRDFLDLLKGAANFMVSYSAVVVARADCKAQ